jgi:hypothetical protein
MTTKYLSAAETAKLVRSALKEAFPSIKFSVRSKTYSGGASVDVHWIDGPTAPQVEAIAKQYEGATFDGMTDCKSYHEATLDGERVHFGADFIFCTRDDSEAAIAGAIRRVCQRFGVAGDQADMLAKYKRGELWNVTVAGVDGHDSHWNLQTQIRIASSRHTFCLTRRAASLVRLTDSREFGELS